MQISLSETGKRFNRDWIFRHFTYSFLEEETYAITGPNGSGKSTLLQVVAGAIAHSEGTVTYCNDSKTVEPEKAFRHISIATPYEELIEEMTLTEFLQFHVQFKPFLSFITLEEVIRDIGLEHSANKQIRYYSSGMKQRVKLAQAIFSKTSCVLLDEPCTNLDEEGINLYHRLIRNYCSNRMVIVSSNEAQEYNFCKNRIDIMEYKKTKVKT